ncbi:hypothetical protein INT48_005389 [Thamnidium elegans]|uniref:Uncharacterized protein n=1 Tax=Thamnidium elegans TaxID=101142 RepID=A0A8H7SIK0_9FUNG|nr:hypothetical protein INT48_005389 [Thamnidium elegans]
MAEYVNTRGETTLKELVDLHQNSVREYISQFDKKAGETTAANPINPAASNSNNANTANISVPPPPDELASCDISENVANDARGSSNQYFGLFFFNIQANI